MGQIREILAREMLRPVLPASVGVGTGKIVDHLGSESRQIDLIIFDRNVMAPLVYGSLGEVGLFPVEACYYAIEIKSKSTPAEVRKTILGARSICDLEYVPEFCINGIPRERVVPVLLALDTTARTWETERDRWIADQHDVRYPIALTSPNGRVTRFDVPPLRVACVVGRGYGYFNMDGQWAWLPAEPDRREVLGLMAGIANSIPSFASGRLGLPFGHYFTGEGPSLASNAEG
ncbi:MAG: hypothetical protein JWQ18_1479 [Conexibacter sp.]|nr:hypothetical protein [Conexibacter sp.]